MSSDILLRARQSFRASRTVESLQKITVPEWGDDFALYFWPVMSVEERMAVRSHVKLGETRTLADITATAVTQIVKRARNVHGILLFTDADRKAFEDTDPTVLERISSEMGFGADVTIEAAEKN
jgi:hypothetical protein